MEGSYTLGERRKKYLLKTLMKLNSKLEAVQHSIDSYLETKRQAFPRFYFISNDDLLSILGQIHNPLAIQPHLKKCFDNISRLEIGKSVETTFPLAVGMYSDDGEYVEFPEPVIMSGFVEAWLLEVENAMQYSLRCCLPRCLADLESLLEKEDSDLGVWMESWPGQVCLMSLQILWTAEVTRGIKNVQESGVLAPLKNIRRRWKSVLNKISAAMMGEHTATHEKYMAIILTLVYARDVLDLLLHLNCNDMHAFEWISQLRYYYSEEKDDCIVQQTTAEFLYAYEYLGNRRRLVITPLTARCYLTLTTALYLNQGVCLKGPTGCGKTESVKDLGKALGCYVLIINCSDGLDFKSLGRILSGLAQIGAWCSFDEFNRINVEVLSVVAQQILTILAALKARSRRFVFGGTEIPLRPSCGIFITVNPAYYAGRSELPFNLVYMFRPMSMIVPDIMTVAEIILYANSFEDSKLLAQKIQVSFSIAAQQLSKQFHYDFGLRAVIKLLQCAITEKRENKNLTDEEMIFAAMNEVTIPKLRSSDVPVFQEIMVDVFGDIRVAPAHHEKLMDAIQQCLNASSLQKSPVTVSKVIQFYETKEFHHAVILIGETGSGKSTTLQILKDAYNLLNEQGVPDFPSVQIFPFNPKAVTLPEVFGQLDLASGDWKDGILSSLVRVACNDSKPTDKWILFSGPADTQWVESMNSLMDDNKILTLINGERIVLSPRVSLVFEVVDLSQCSPATVSRCGVVYHDYSNLTWEPYFETWLQKLPNKSLVDELKILSHKFLKPMLKFKKFTRFEFLPVTELNSVMSFCKLFEAVIEYKIFTMDTYSAMEKKRYLDALFVFSLVWSIGGNADELGRKKINDFLYEVGAFIPTQGSVYDYVVHPKQSWIPWKHLLPDSWSYNERLAVHKILVPTKDTLSCHFISSALLHKAHHVLLVGNVGTGKSLIGTNILQNMDASVFSSVTMNMSVQTTSIHVQNVIESSLQKKSRGIFIPASGQKLIAFMDDFNMPAKDKFGVQSPLELILMWMDFGFWYDREKIVPKHIQNMVILAAMGPPGGSRNVISSQLMNRFSVLNVISPQDAELLHIFGTLLHQKFSCLPGEIKELSSVITQTVLNIYAAVSSVFLPTPRKIHYLFSLRDIAKVVQGLLQIDPRGIDSRLTAIKFLCHECQRVFSDRLVNGIDRDVFNSILDKELRTSFDLTISDLSENCEIPLFVNFITAEKYYEEVKDLDNVKDVLSQCMDNIEEQSDSEALDLVLFKSAVHHACHIARGLQCPGGSMLLIGADGSGRKSLSRLMAFTLGFSTYQLTVAKDYGVNEFREDIKKLLYITGVETQPTLFLLTDVHLVNEVFMQYVNDILTSGEVLGLFAQDELDSMYAEIASSYQGDCSKGGIHECFIDNVKSYLHIVICLSSSGLRFREHILTYPAIINYSSVEWYEEWPVDALISIAAKYLSNVDVGNPAEKRRQAMAEIFSSMHGSVIACAQKMMQQLNRQVIISSANYLAFVKNFASLLTKKSKEMKTAVTRLEAGLKKIDETEAKVNIMAAELKVAQVEVSKFQVECDEYLVIISEQKKEADVKQEIVAAQSIEIEREEAQCKILAEAAERDLNAALPLLEEAKKALESLNKKDIGEIKSYPKPPILVETVMEAVMILRESEPTWAEAKRQLGNPFFLRELMEFEKDNISDNALTKIGKYVAKADFKPHIIGKVSIAAKSLCMWVRAMHSYGRLYRMVLPKRQRLFAAQEALRIQQEQLAEAQRKLKELNDKIQRLKQEYEDKLRRKEELFEEERMLKLKLERAAKLVDGLKSEKKRWEHKVGVLKEKIAFVIGDSIIASGFMAYLGQFLSSYRESIVYAWRKKICSLEISCSPTFDLADFLISETAVTNWNVQGLPTDHYSTENAIIITESDRWPLIIDPQEQAAKWIKKMERDQGLKIVDIQDPSYLRTLQMAVSYGMPVLIQNVASELDPVLDPILKKSFIKHENQKIVHFCDEDIIYNSMFKLYLATKRKNPNFAPDVGNKTCIVNFAIKQKGLEDQLLSITVKKERPDLEEQKKKLVTTISAGKEKLQELEETVLRLLNEAEGSLLDDVVLVEALQTSKETSMEIEGQLDVSQMTESYIDTAREAYRPCAKRASVLFFALDDMSSIDPMYLFSLDPYVELFIASIEKSLKDVDVERRIDKLNDYHTYSVYKYACRAVFEKHKLLLSFHMCSMILEAAQAINMEEYDFFLRGGVVYDRTNQPPNPCPLWLPHDCWDNITAMESLPKFLDLSISFDENARFWQDWYMNPEPEKMFLPGKWRNTCSEFQKMLFIRALRPDRITTCISNFICNNLGKKYLEPPVLDMQSVLSDSNSKTPLLFILSSGVDPVEYVSALAKSSGMKDRYFVLSLGQGQASHATRLLKDAQAQGNWIYLANCHLLLSYMPMLEKITAEFESEELHNDFRLWLSSMPTPHFPVSILQNSIKITTETPKGLKSNMRKLYSTVLQEGVFSSCKKQSKYLKLLFSLSFLHSVLIERRKFQNLGWNVVYNFNEADFKMSEQILRVYLDMYDYTPWDAIHHLIVDINYGGHITDEQDVHVLNAYFEQFFSDEVLLVPAYQLSHVPTYYIPKEGPFLSHIEYIESLPQEEPAEVFGQNANAEISFRVQEASFLFENLLKAHPSKVSAMKKSMEETVLDVIENILHEIPDSINENSAYKLLEKDPSPYHYVLLQETERYNALLKLIRSSLRQLQHGITGIQLMTSFTDELFATIQNSHVPSSWLKTYPSVKLLGSYISDLKLRVQQVTDWIENGEPPVKFWLSGFTSPRAILNAALQIAARQGDLLIHDLKWEFIVSALEEAHITELPEDGIYVRGLYLEGAGWNKKHGLLTEPEFMHLISPMPVIHFKPVHEVNTRGMFHCPCYYIPKRTYNGTSTYVMSVDLKSRKPVNHWIKRGTALLMNDM